MTKDYRNRLEPQDSTKTTTVSTRHGTCDIKIADIQLTMMYKALLLHPMKLTRTQPSALKWWRQVFNLKGNQEKLLPQALEIVRSEGKASTSFLQRKLQIGYNRAARIIDMMEADGIVSKANHVGKRDVL